MTGAGNSPSWKGARISACWLGGTPPRNTSVSVPRLMPEERARETLALNLRRAAGVIRARFCEQTGFELGALAGAAIQRHVETGLLIDDGSDVRLTRAGRCVADSIVADLL